MSWLCTDQNNKSFCKFISVWPDRYTYYSVMWRFLCSYMIRDWTGMGWPESVLELPIEISHPHSSEMSAKHSWAGVKFFMFINEDDRIKEYTPKSTLSNPTNIKQFRSLGESDYSQQRNAKHRNLGLRLLVYPNCPGLKKNHIMRNIVEKVSVTSTALIYNLFS